MQLLGSLRLTRLAGVGGDYLLNGSKTWITNSPIADVAVVWAKSAEHDGKVPPRACPAQGLSRCVLQSPPSDFKSGCGAGRQQFLGLCGRVPVLRLA